MEGWEDIAKMTEHEYRTHPAISRSELWRLRESPEKFIYYREHPTEPTTALIFGQMVHKLVLEGATFGVDFVVAPDCDRRTKLGKAEWEIFQASVGDRTVVSPDDFEKAAEMAEAIRNHPLAARLLGGRHETPHFWTDPDTGEECKCRTDAEVWIDGQLWIVDYKTTADASTDGFQKEAHKYGYGFQAAMYSEGVEADTGIRPVFAFVAQEKQPPYAVNIFVADEEFVSRGYDTFRELLGLYHECKETGNWFGYLGPDMTVNILELPAWLREKSEN